MDHQIENEADKAICYDMGRLEVSYKFDCKFIVGSDPDKAETVYGCKHSFAIESPVFDRMLFGDFQEAKDPTKGIPLPDDDPNVVRHFRLITCNSSERASRLEALSLDETLKLTQFCHKYLSQTVFKLCSDRLLTLCETAKFTQLIEMFVVTRHIPGNLHSKVIEKLTKFGFRLVSTLNDLSQDDFSAYLQQHVKIPRYSNLNLFNTIQSYIEDNDLIPNNLLDEEKIEEETRNGKEIEKESRDGVKIEEETRDVKVIEKETRDDSEIEDKQKVDYLQQLLNLIDFSQIETRVFISGPGNSNILSLEQKYYILSSICKGLTQIKIC